MTVMLLRLHPAMANPSRWIALTTGVLLLATLLTGALVAARGEAGRDVVREAAWPVAAALLWATIAIQLLLPAGRRRAGPFAMTLPVSGRRLWLTSLLCSFLTAGLTALVIVFVADGAGGVLRSVLGQDLFGAGAYFYSGLPQVLAAAALACALLHLPRPGQERWPLGGWLGLYGFGAAVVPGVLLILFRDWPVVFSAACLAVAATLVYWGLRRQPEALVMSVDEGVAGEPAAGWMPAWPWLTAVRWTFGLPAFSAAVATSMGFGVLQAVMSSRYSEEDETGLLMAPMLIYIMVTWLAVGGRFLHRLGPLPLSHRAVTSLLTLPVLAAAMLGYGVGLGLAASGSERMMVEFRSEAGFAFPLQPSKQATLRLPAHRYEIAWDGQAPELRAPWGEVHKPWQARIWKGASAVLYSPVSTAEAVTPEFAGWEISQAIELVYGIRVPHEQVRAQYIGIGAGGRPVLVKDLRDFVPEGTLPVSPLRQAVAPLTITVCGASYLLLAGLLFGLRRADVLEWKRTAAAVAVMIGLMALYLIRAPLSFSGVTRGWILGGALSSLTRSAVEATPGGAVTLWLVCVVALWLSFRFAEARLARAEVLREPPRRFGF